MIQIDDAGSGSFIGGTCIGIYRPETNEYYFDIIPVEFYNKENFKKKLYLDAVVDIVKDAFEALNVKEDESVEICRGYMFDNLKKYLKSQKYTWYTTHITGHFQNLVEKNFERYTVKIGLPEQYIKYTRYPFHFHKLLRWVYADFEERIDLCKVGWKCWAHLENTKLYTYFDTMSFSNYYCLYCGEHISKGSNVKILKFISNHENYVYMHDVCYKV